MKKLVIILVITIMLFATPKQPTEQVDKATTSNCELIPAESEAATKEKPAEQETPLKECTDETKRSGVAESEETVQCVDKGDQNLAEYKPQPSGQPNPFENAPPTEIVDQPVEDLIGEGEDRPGEGKHF